MPELSAPDATASRAPRGLTCTEPMSARLRARARGTARAKFDAVATRGRLAPRPRSEYAPQATPAAIINAAPAGSGALRPGRSAIRHRSELAAKPIRAAAVRPAVRIRAQHSTAALTAPDRGATLRRVQHDPTRDEAPRDRRAAGSARGRRLRSGGEHAQRRPWRRRHLAEALEAADDGERDAYHRSS